MNVFRCVCGQRVYFDNSVCLGCGRNLSFDPLSLSMRNTSYASSLGLRPCARLDQGCTWLTAQSAASAPRTQNATHSQPHNSHCLSCSLLQFPGPGGKLQLETERAQKRFIYSWLQLGLPLVPRQRHPRGLSIRLLQSSPQQRVTIGHCQGLITLDVKEADPSEREATRLALGEPYRTPLGHYRHESGHYLWELLFDTESRRETFRSVYGDERRDYTRSLKDHYAASDQSSWTRDYVSHYATSHPWEDWAETWAHYLHIIDSSETAKSFGIEVERPLHRSNAAPTMQRSEFDERLDDWIEMMLAVNALNRSLGHGDPYPFALPPGVRRKLLFIHEQLQAQRERLNELLQTPAAHQPALHS